MSLKSLLLTSCSAFAVLALLAPAAQAQTKICIDPGHGGSDSGATGGGYLEKTIVLDVASRLKSWLDSDTADSGGGGSWSVYRTRTTDVFVDLTPRSTYANGIPAARFMSLHNNAFNSSANGIETFSHTSNGATSNDLRNKIYEEAIAMWPLVRRGAKQANYAVLRETNMPAELHEQAFIDTSVDRVYLTNATHQQNQSKSEMWGLQRHYGFAKYTPGSSQVIVTVDNTDSGFSASTNWFASTSVAGYLGANYHTRAAALLSDPATYTANLPSDGNYQVQARWTAATNRATATPYIITTASGDVTVQANQQNNNGVWVTLGTYYLYQGLAPRIKVSCYTSSGAYVVADGVRFVKQ